MRTERYKMTKLRRQGGCTRDREHLLTRGGGRVLGLDARACVLPVTGVSWLTSPPSDKYVHEQLVICTQLCECCPPDLEAPCM
eukprot:scaffold99316_cov19-Tisochrysis_lutea.AAC.3